MFHEKLKVYEESVGVAEELCKEVARWPRGLGFLADQLRRAMGSIVLNIAEANGREGTMDRRRFFRIAKGSAAEVAACVDLMRVYRLISVARSEELKVKLFRIDRMLWGLVR